MNIVVSKSTNEHLSSSPPFDAVKYFYLWEIRVKSVLIMIFPYVNARLFQHQLDHHDRGRSLPVLLTTCTVLNDFLDWKMLSAAQTDEAKIAVKSP